MPDNHTQLDGAVIASTASVDKNSLDTGTLGFSDIHNEADFKTQHSGISLSGGGAFGGDQFKGNMPGGMISAAGNSGHVEGTTQAAVADGTITVRDKAGQKQDAANLSRDTEHANDSISPIFDKEKEQNRLKAVGLISEIGGQAADIARTQGEINALKEAKKTYGELKPGATEKEREDWLVKLRNSPEYQGEMKKYGTGSDIQRGIQAATAALQGLAGGNIAGALAGASAPELANIIGHKAGLSEDDIAAKAIAHAILGGAVAAMQGNNVAAGAAGSAAGELAANAILKTMYPGKRVSELDESDRQLVSNLATIASGLAGNLAGGDSKSTTTGAQSGKNSVENNALSDIVQAQSEGKTLEQKAEEHVKVENERYKQQNCAGMSAEACSVQMYSERREALKNTVSTAADFVPVVGTIKSAVEAQSALDYLNVAASLIPGERVASGVLKAAEKALVKGDVAEASKLINKASDEIATASRPSHRQSEIDVGKDLGDGWREQVSFKDGKEVPYGTKGGVRPDWCQGNVCSVEVKNYNITTNKNGLINNVAKQAVERQKNLPAGMQQQVVIDIRGQSVTAAERMKIVKGIVDKSNGAITPSSIRFKTK
ncbi:VENN motif pre-toxin domain-containing protein [Salmonella enterica]|nr:VENN motif pre-toxin domain-containing protein [Salmonella enterica]